MRGPLDDLPSPTDTTPMPLAGALVIPLLGLGLLHGLMAGFDAFFV